MRQELNGGTMIPILEVEEIFDKRMAIIEAEVKRLREVEASYLHLLTLVKVVAQQDKFSMDQNLEILISKQAQVSSKSWEDLLQTHFMHKNKSRITGV